MRRRSFPSTISAVCVTVATFAACSSPTPATSDAGTDAAPEADCGAPFLGDASKPVDFEIRALRVDGSDGPLADGGDVALIFPPQGGRVIFVGVRATNIDACGVQLTGALRDLANNQVRIDARTVNLIPSGDGWGTSAPPTQSVSSARDTYSNVPLCPNEWATTDVFDHEFQLEVTVRDRGNRALTRSIKVTPRCSEPDKRAECLCICKGGYVLGQACDAADAGDQ